MTEKKKTDIKSATTKSADAVRFPVDKLRPKCRQLFDVNECTFDGAMHGKSGEYTVAEMKEIIKKWKGERVK